MQALIEGAEGHDDTAQNLIQCQQPRNKNSSLILGINPEENKFNDSVENQELTGNFANVMEYVRIYQSLMFLD